MNIFYQLQKFSMAGLAGTVLQYIILLEMVNRQFNPIISSSFGLLAGAIVVYAINYYITFSSSRRHTDVLKRFLPMVITGFFLNGWILSNSLNYLPLIVAQFFATAAQFLFGFFVSRLWVY